MLGLIETGLSFADRLIKGVEELKQIKISQKTLLRSYYFEVTTNLELLNLVNKEALKKLTVFSPAVSSVCEALETQIGAYIVFNADEKANKLMDFLNAKGKVTETEEEGESGKPPAGKTKTILQAIDFTLRKITILQKLAMLKGETDKEIINSLRLKVRVNNIVENLELIGKKLKELNKTEDFII